MYNNFGVFSIEHLFSIYLQVYLFSLQFEQNASDAIFLSRYK